MSGAIGISCVAIKKRSPGGTAKRSSSQFFKILNITPASTLWEKDSSRKVFYVNFAKIFRISL